VARRPRRQTLEPASQIPAEDVESHEEAGRGWELVDVNPECPQGGTMLGLIELVRIHDSTTSLLRWTSAMSTGLAAEGRPDAWHARK